MTLDVNKIASQDAAYWAQLKRIQLQKGCFTFEKREYLREPMQVNAYHVDPLLKSLCICYMKGTQLGFTEKEVNQVLHGLIHGHYPRGVLYIMPTMDDVREFSKARFGPLISANPSAIGQYVNSVANKTDTANLKKVGSAMLFLRGGTLPTRMEADTREASKLRSISVDKVVFDELDMMEKDVRKKAEGRLGDSDVYEQAYISNPVLPDSGISAIFETSDKRHWFRRCGCGKWTCAELEFPNLVARDSNGRGYIACIGCGKEVKPYTEGNTLACEWVPKHPDRTAQMRGYQLGQLSSANRDPWKILQDYNSADNAERADIVRLKLGWPYLSAEDRLTVPQVLACCGFDQMRDSHAGPCAMGVDVRAHKNVIVGIRTGPNTYKILRVARVSDWEDILRMAIRFNVKSCVVDIRPYEDSARQFQSKMRKCRTYLCEYTETSIVGTQFNSHTGIVKANRTEVMDATHRLIADSATKLELPCVTPEVQRFAQECCSVAKVPEINKRTNTQIFRYRKLSSFPDDYRHALNYFYIAASSGMIGTAQGYRQKRSGYATNNRKLCGRATHATYE
jgi:hypothetical protein